MKMQPKTYILVHGGWHGDWCWTKVVPLLEARGNRVLAIDLPNHGNDQTPPTDITLDDYVRKVAQLANEQNGPVILVGHSSAGIVISQVAEDLGPQKVATLVYLDAFLPRNGESVMSLAEKVMAQSVPVQVITPLMANLILSEDKRTGKLKLESVGELLYHDCPAEDVNLAKEKLDWQSLGVLGTPVKVTDERYGAIPKVYILCTQAKDLDKSSIAQNVPCQKVYKLASSHSPFFSMPGKLAEIIDEL